MSAITLDAVEEELGATCQLLVERVVEGITFCDV
jgi:hypothetical protein